MPLGWQGLPCSGIPEFMRAASPRGTSGKFLACLLLSCTVLATLAVSTPLCAQQPDPFRWMDFHSDKDQDIIVWVSRSLAAEKWTAIREIGVQYDAALVVTTLRASPDAAANADTFSVWSVSLTNHLVTPLLKGYNLRWLNMMTFKPGALSELPIFYDSCVECSPDTNFTAFHFDMAQHTWAARWLRGGQGVPVSSQNMPTGVTLTQVYAGLTELDGRQFLATWNHFDYDGQKPAEDSLYRYDIDPFSGLERTALVSGKDADKLKIRICRGDLIPGLAHGQDSPLCDQVAGPRPGRRPVTTPPVANRGKSTPPGSRH